ncbi:hypothetical protein ACHAXH_004972 [Discostella pseudostelligera]
MMPPSPSQSTSSAWECHKCNVSNTTKRCSSCHAWKDGVTPLMASRLAKKKKKNNNNNNNAPTPSLPSCTSTLSALAVVPPLAIIMFDQLK